MLPTGLLPNSPDRAGAVARGPVLGWKERAVGSQRPRERHSMMGAKTFRPKGIYHLDWDQRIPANHLVRRVAETVDFAFVRRQTARFYSHTGTPGVAPVVLVKLALLGYLYGITSERRLAEEVRLNLAFLWFLGYDLDEPTPDHSALSKARRRFGVTVYQAF